MRLEMGGIDHQKIGLPGPAREGGEDAVEHAEPAPTDEAIVERLVRTIVRWRIAPAHAGADHVHDATENTSVVHAGDAVRQRKVRFDPRHLRVRKPERIIHAAHLPTAWNHQLDLAESLPTLIGPEPSTHSAPLVNLLPEASLKFFYRGRKGASLVTAHAPPILLKSIGIDPPIVQMLLVEDDAAAEFIRALLEKIAPSYSRQVRAIVRHGEGEITNSLRELQFYSGAPSFVGLYDGDMRGNAPEDLKDYCAFLPGDRRVELMFREMVANNPECLEVPLMTDGLDAILAGLQGADDHDWFRRLGEEAGLTRSQLFPILFNIWYRLEGSAEAATKTHQRLKELEEKSGKSLSK